MSELIINPEMKIDTNEIDYCKVGVKYQASPNDVKDKRNFVAKEMVKSYDVKGFRKGKASAEVIKLTYPNELNAHLKQEMLNKAFSDTITEKNIKPFGGPTVETVALNGNSFECSFTVHTLPEFELGEYKNFNLPKHHVGTTVDELSQQIFQGLRTENATLVPYGEDDFIQLTDSIIVQYSSSVNGEPIERLASEGTVLEVGRINIPGFDDNILGMKPDEEREFTLKTPSKDFDPEFLDQDLTFKVKLISGSKKVPAALDDTLAQKVGLADFATLTTQVQGLAGAKIQEIENGHYHLQIGKRLIANHTFEVPTWIAIPEAKVQVQMQKKSWDELTEEERSKQIKDAEDGIKLSLILGKIQDNEPESQLEQSELLEMAKKNISQYTNEPEKVLQDVYSKGQMGMLLSRIKDEFSLNFILKNCNIVE